MSAPAVTDSAIDLRRLYWIGPATVIGATLGVGVAQRLVIRLVGSIPPALRFPVLSAEPLVITAILVTGAVIVFAVIADNAAEPIRTFRRVAASVLAVSFVPNVVAAVSLGVDAWRPALGLGALHVIAWGITVGMLTELTRVRQHQQM